MQGSTISKFPPLINSISTGFIPDPFAGDGVNVLAVLVGVILSLLFLLSALNGRKQSKKYGFETQQALIFWVKNIFILAAIMTVTIFLALYNGIPIVMVVLVGIASIYAFLTQKTVIGRRVYALGGNSMAAAMSGISIKKMRFFIFINMGVLAAIAGIVFTGRLDAANSRAGDGYELDAIAACVIGGASLSGGRGTVFGAVLGTFVMGVLNNGMSLIGLGSDWQQIVKGIVLTFAVLYDIMSKKKSN